MGESLFHRDVLNLHNARVNALSHRIDSTVELRAKVLEFAHSDAVFGETGAAMSGYWENVHGGILNAWQEAIAKYSSGLAGLRGRLRSTDSDPETVVFDDHVLDIHQLLSGIAATCITVDAGLRAVSPKVTACGVDATGLNLGNASDLLAQALGITEETLEEFYRLNDFTDANSDLAEVERLLDVIERQVDGTTMLGPDGQIEFNATGFAASNPGLAMSEAAMRAKFDRLMGLDPDEQEEVVARFLARGLDRLTEAELWVLLGWLGSEDVSHQQVADAILAARRVGADFYNDRYFTNWAEIQINGGAAPPDLYNLFSPLRGRDGNRTQESLYHLQSLFDAMFSQEARAFMARGGEFNFQRICDETRPLIHLLGREQLLWTLHEFPRAHSVDLSNFHTVDAATGLLQVGVTEITIDGNRAVYHSLFEQYVRGNRVLSGRASSEANAQLALAANLAETSEAAVFWGNLLESVGGALIGEGRNRFVSNSGLQGRVIDAGVTLVDAFGGAQNAVNEHREQINTHLQSADNIRDGQVFNYMGYGVRFAHIPGRDPIIRGVNRETDLARAVMENVNAVGESGDRSFVDVTFEEAEHAIRQRQDHVADDRLAEIYARVERVHAQ